LQNKFQDNVSDLDQSWNGDSLGFGFKTFGIKVTGTIEVADHRITVDGELPLTAMMFKGKIESEMRQQLERLLK
jgi:Putative polyhydroxyalkanoic acid system protein (PHA_gran_rgn)